MHLRGSGTEDALPKVLRVQSLGLSGCGCSKRGVRVDLYALSGEDNGAGSHVVANHQSAVHWEVASAYANTSPGHLIGEKVYP